MANFPLPDSLEALLRGYQAEPSIEVVTIVNDNLTNISDRLVSRVNNSDATLPLERPIPKAQVLESIANQPHARNFDGNFNINTSNGRPNPVGHKLSFDQFINANAYRQQTESGVPHQ